MNNLYNNASWPWGKWRIDYVQEIDKWRITVSHTGIFVADVGPTLVANWMIAINNILYSD